MDLNIIFSKKYSYHNNFYLWINEHWKENNTIPNDRQMWSCFDQLDKDTKLKIKSILEEEYLENSKYQKFKILYDQGLEEKDMNEVYKYLLRIKYCTSLDQLLKLMVNYQVFFSMNNPIIFGVDNDLKNSEMNILQLFTSGLELPDRDYYFLDSKLNIRNEYKNFLKNYTNFFGINININDIYEIEETLAKYTYTNVEKRNSELYNNPTNLPELLKIYPEFKFIEYLFIKLKKNPGKINISNPKYFSQLNKMYADKNKYSLQTWKNFYATKFLLSINSYLSEDVQKIYFNFYSRILSGTIEMKPLWERSLNNIDSKLGFLLGEYYVNKYFNENSKKIALKLIKYMKLDLYNKIVKLDWMDNSTKTNAIKKLNNMNIKIGYPDKWRIYNANIKKENTYLKNNILCNIDNAKYNFSKLYNKVDKSEWHMNPHEINAYYSPSNNEIVFPAGILQPPFFSENYDVGLNLGGIGTIIGHEITHGFDDEGCKYDSNGNLNNWWSMEVYENYKAKTAILKEQFNKFSIENEFVNGKLTLGENLADLGGIRIAVDSLKKYLLENPNENKLIDGLSPLQRLFINYCRIWRCNIRKEEIKQRLLIDPHSPPEFRVNGILMNIDDFYIAFNIKENSKIYLEKNKRAKIW